MSEGVDENRIGLTGEARTAFINSALDACNKSSPSPTFCSCYANAMADSLSMTELKQMSAAGNEEASVIAFRPKLEAAARRCRTNNLCHALLALPPVAFDKCVLAITVTCQKGVRRRPKLKL